MKRTIIAILLAIALLASLAACGSNATGNEAVTGELIPRSVTLLVTLPDGTQNTHEITSAEQFLGKALDGEGLIGRDAAGMIVTVDGVEASWDNDKAYWGFYIGEDFAMHGVDEEIIANGNTYELRYTKE
ncbi:MAG: DUF4430 domain-containing protein [Oscillospiraceae bacterium]|jgi:hypothetical protein|nr:DUF4430 domain-containing protein [Oscillospiraceae bacterium]